MEALAAGDKVKKKDAAATLADDVVGALLNLGYNKPEAQKATDAALEELLKTDPTPEFKTLLRAALNRLTGTTTKTIGSK